LGAKSQVKADFLNGLWNAGKKGHRITLVGSEKRDRKRERGTQAAAATKGVKKGVLGKPNGEPEKLREG